MRTRVSGSTSCFKQFHHPFGLGNVTGKCLSDLLGFGVGDFVGVHLTLAGFTDRFEPLPKLIAGRRDKPEPMLKPRRQLPIQAGRFQNHRLMRQHQHRVGMAQQPIRCGW